MYIKLKVTAGAKRELVTKMTPDHFEVHVREVAEMNRANKRILEIFRHTFPERRVRMISGHHSAHKILSIDD